MNYEIIATVALGILGTATTILIVLLERKSEKLKIAQAQLAESKYGAYGRLVAIFYDILKNVKLEKATDNAELASKLMDSKKDMFIYGSDEVFNKLNTWLTYTARHPGDQAHMKYFLDLLITIRSDMGHKSTKITKRDLLISIVQDESELEQFKHYL
jgi:hypothetical protein